MNEFYIKQYNEPTNWQITLACKFMVRDSRNYCMIVDKESVSTFFIDTYKSKRHL